GLIDAIEATVQSRRLATTRRPGHQNDAVGSFDQLADQVVVTLAETQLAQVEQHVRLVQQAHHDTLMVPAGWNRGYADVDAAPRNPEGNAPILWQAFFRDIQTCHDLDAGDHGTHELFAGAP